MKLGRTTLELFKGDITTLEVDAIVNAANKSLLGGGGVDGAIHKAAGPDLYDECLTLDGCETGEAKITNGYKLPAKHVIHTVGPVGEKPELLRSAYFNSLEVAKANNIKTIAFPCISTGVYGYPQDRAALVAAETVKTWIEANPDQISRVIFCVFLKKDYEIYQELLPRMFEPEQ